MGRTVLTCADSLSYTLCLLSTFTSHTRNHHYCRIIISIYCYLPAPELLLAWLPLHLLPGLRVLCRHPHVAPVPLRRRRNLRRAAAAETASGVAGLGLGGLVSGLRLAVGGRGGSTRSKEVFSLLLRILILPFLQHDISWVSQLH